MNDQSQAAADTDNLMIDTLRACGFFVRAGDPLIGQRPQVVGSIDNAIAFFKLAIAGVDAATAAPVLIASADVTEDGIEFTMAEWITMPLTDRNAARRYRYLRDTPGMMAPGVWNALEGADAVGEDGNLDQATYAAELDRSIDIAISAQRQKAGAA